MFYHEFQENNTKQFQNRHKMQNFWVTNSLSNSGHYGYYDDLIPIYITWQKLQNLVFSFLALTFPAFTFAFLQFYVCDCVLYC